jgi:hypothetical protein
MIRTSRLALVIIDLTHTQPFSHRASLDDQHPQGTPSRANLICYGTSLLWL